mmetsp:Transcript_31990/g.90805  ORF Transcript_31990/g.90805 Transcript_31990/m.90805 type:complete len:325 (-) Transcript_31990:73-1047(-)|eukprot:CAMPEP_0117668462 /NCGR_PEP_ID=MMETSP0804-20121206/11564_1 /TAXON_ID=1074897 /ORGANISM="Tetraselmis astigmatica, Strain CCMP880" /LENGTH=324 /DNA_ID=CAMNT_0005476359 /DNA_START=83 /DNA_END=1057 /DNA_ORIENTATION=-
MEEGVQSLEELTANLREYKSQLEQVKQLVEVEPENEEYQEMLQSLKEVIELTEDLVNEQQQPEQTTKPSRSRFGPPVAPSGTDVAAAAAAPAAPAAAATAAPIVSAAPISTAGLPAVVAEQIKAAQARQARLALLGQAPPAWAVGHTCRACYTDGEWYDAKVEAVTAAGAFVIKYEGYDEQAEVAFPNIQPPPEVEEVYKGVSAPKRRKVEDDVSKPIVIPASLEILPGDSEKEIHRKKKAIKKIKSERRFQEMDSAQKNRQKSWQDFQKGKGKAKTKGFLTGKKKESMFKSPEGVDGKVGVVGSGRGMTDFHNRGRHEFVADE